jgi:DNA invertase Pin-like site-specific DNA recombinase
VTQRAKLAECLAFLRQWDVLTVTKPDRLARSTAELLMIEADLSKRGVHLIVLSMGGERLDTRNPTSKLMLTILARLSQLAPNNPAGGRFPVVGSCKVGTTGATVIAISECHPT